MKPRVVFDANTLFSGSLWSGSPARCLDLARSGRVVSITCSEIIAELARILPVKGKISTLKQAFILADVDQFSLRVAISNTLKAVPRDPDDDKIIECAVVGKASYIVSGDKDLLDLKEYNGILILRASELLTKVSERS